MGVLDQILEYKKQRDAQTYADIMAIPTAVQTFSNARQQAKENLLKELSLNVSAASSGLKIDPNTGSITRDDSLKSDLEKLIEKGKAAEAAKNMGDRGLYETITGKSTIQNTPAAPVAPTGPAIAPVEGVDQVGEAPEQTSIDQASIDQITAPEIDTFTGKFTPAGEKQDARNKVILKQLEAQASPLSGESAQRYSGALQGLESVNDIMKILRITKDEKGNVAARKDYRDVIRGSKAASFQEPNVRTGLLSEFKLTGGLTEGIAQKFAGDDARLLDLNLRTYAENEVRARTGASMPPKEQVDAELRTLVRQLDTPKVMLARLEKSAGYFKNTVNSIRPGSTKGVKAGKPAEFTPEQEKDIADTAKHYGKTVEQVKADIKKKGINPWA